MTFEKCYRVGGCVRDRLLGLEPTDIDYVVIGESPESMLSRGFTQVGGDFPVFLHPETGDEYALGRSEISTGDGYNDFKYKWEGITLEQDLGRRDCTINAMAELDDGTVFDPYGGQQDLQNRTLRHVGPSFAEDPLRILRVARFAARYDFSVAPETMSLMTEMTSKGMLNPTTPSGKPNIKPERIWKETEKAMLTPNPHVYFDVLDACGALKVLFPELEQMKGVPQRDDYHAEGDVWIHTKMVLDEAAKLTTGHSTASSLRIRMAALLHDLGKIKTPADLLWYADGSVRGHHHGHENVERFEGLLDTLAARIKMPSEIQYFVHKCALTHQEVHRISSAGRQGLQALYERLDLDRIQRHDKAFLGDVATMCAADNFGRRIRQKDGSTKRPETYLQGAYLLSAMEAVSSVKPGPIMQATMAKEEARAIARNRTPDKALILEAAKTAVRTARRDAVSRFLKEQPETDFGPGR
ncbi:HD domain-containing protein [Pseudomonas serbica]|jgi:tRNA nucleotidyltransferase (CCA-adding enzyme)|uniref:HD domain-containing protein n=1 Tax=Pseudomonas serbica TaxID=2965074 RepID=UPI00237A373F|nr:HD domain-containing protein [Pseudomonas serbica]